ncbi:altronate hydrolase [Catalinimonas alkaloidigena]|uniref:UxaA family hydrolase n=1 Tax=Catalinimonas alkaloidigena TaxID=1075417 RepID=UPI002404C61E|nr:altronate dehydratase family protein [Catalinimonas alkaloidigena]MDF9800452.1 altronate hydrolase [Catalinimonas alkaloidigena]
MRKKILKIHPNDNLIVALDDLSNGEKVELEGETYQIQGGIPPKHKFVTQDLEVGDKIYMYGVLVGKAMQPIKKGEAITVSNVKHDADTFSLGKRKTEWNAPDASSWKDTQFMGYHRENEQVGVANYWLFIPLVFCENRNINVIREALVKDLGYDRNRTVDFDIQSLISKHQHGASSDELLTTEIVITAEEMQSKRTFPNVDGVKFLTHEGGCGGTREDSNTLCALFAGYITHPNVAGATVLSLGCQNAEVKILQEEIKKRDPNFNKPLYIMEQQKSKSEREFISAAIKKTFVGLTEANKIERKPAPLSKLVVGLECGGSDGFSGISANPSVGHAADLLVALGGSVILSEFPELNGVEQELTDRCIDDATAEKFISIMRAYSASAEAVGSGFDANPSPGNIKDGLITDAIKSAGAAKKGGTSPVVDVLDYTEPVTKNGLNLLCTPGNDVESTTGLAGSGASIILFTTGLGTPTGNPVAPTLKISSNSVLAKRMEDIIDINAGTVISGEDSINSKGEEILDFIIRTASGTYTPKAVAIGQDDFIPWKRGVSL